MESIQQRYAIPANIAVFIENGFLEMVSEEPDRKTVEFHIPALRQADEEGRTRTYSLIWIHPDFNAQFCHYYATVPGDVANFYVEEEVTDLGGEALDLSSVDDLAGWLERVKGASSAA